MKIKMTIENRSADVCPFIVYWMRKNALGGYESIRFFQTEAEAPGAKLELEFDWPFDIYTPWQLKWKSAPETAGKWAILYGAVDGKPLLANVPPGKEGPGELFW